MRCFDHLQHHGRQPAGGGQALHLVGHLALLVGLVVHFAEDQQLGGLEPGRGQTECDHGEGMVQFHAR